MIIHDDCMKVNYAEILQGKKIDLVMLDPPYMTTDLKFDKEKFDLKLLMEMLYPHLKETAWVFLWATMELASLMIPIYRRKFEYIWEKPSLVMKTPDTVRPYYQHEICYVFIRSDLKKVSTLYFDPIHLRTEEEPYMSNRAANENQSEYMKSNRTMRFKPTKSENTGFQEGTTLIKGMPKSRMKAWERTDHQTQKPLGIYEMIFKTYCPHDGLVLDLCAGSGTSEVSALRNNRRCISIEKEDKYAFIINLRTKQWLENFR